jgi:hypothetical protein
MSQAEPRKISAIKTPFKIQKHRPTTSSAFEINTTMNLTFEIVGTHEGDNHALPKIKKTRNSYWTPEAQRYTAWKRHVVDAFIQAARQARIEQSVDKRLVQFSLYPPEVTGRKPIEILKAANCRMDIFISFKNGRHADPENIFGSIADALFQNDARLRGSFDFSENDPKAKVRVSIRATPEKEMSKSAQKSGTI